MAHINWQRSWLWRYLSIMASQLTRASTVCSTDFSGQQQRKYQSFTLLVICEGNHWWRQGSTHNRPVTQRDCHVMTSSCNSFNPGFVKLSKMYNCFSHTSSCHYDENTCFIISRRNKFTHYHVSRLFRVSNLLYVALEMIFNASKTRHVCLKFDDGLNLYL